ncbi:MAG: HlyD family efflux transporter periplasmic adaptor subunit [Planctomycetota bacterium]
MKKDFRYLLTTLVLSTCLALVGCDSPDEAIVQRRPRPVATRTLIKQLPPNAALVTASAAAWKTEDLGFEVSGRVEFVVDQNAEIEGRTRDASGKLILAGTPIARIESERYELAVATAKATVARAEQDLVVARTDLDETIPAKIEAANASVELARVEYDRSKRLRAQNANSQSSLDTAKASFQNAAAELKQLLAAEKSQKSQIESYTSAVLQAKQKLRDAERDLEDCTLYSSFRGKVAETFVVPGSLVSEGAPVVTLQMMDPLKIELEVSGEQSRKLQRTQVLPVYMTMPDGSVRVTEGFLHQIDPSADELTRTFTLTILVLNQPLAKTENSKMAKTRDVWRLDLPFIPGAEPGDLYVEERSILTDDQGDYLWQITNFTIQSRSPETNIFDVRKLRIRPGEAKVPYLGELIFQRIEVQDEDFDPAKNLVIGELYVDGMNPSQWVGDQVLLDSLNRWMLRPGDLVKVDLSGGAATSGLFVPMDAISRKSGETAIFVVDSTGGTPVAKRVPVNVASGDMEASAASLRRIEAIGDVILEGVQYVTKGTHFLVDGEPVSVVADAEADE